MDSGKISKLLLIFLILGLIPLSASISEVDVLVVNDGHTLDPSASVDYSQEVDENFEDIYNESLKSIQGVDVDYSKTSDDEKESGPSLETMNRYDMVVWYTLADSASSPGGFRTLTSTDEENVREYLNQGGTFYLTGHTLDNEESLYGEGSFLREVMNARYKDNDGSPNYWRFTDRGSNDGEDWEYVQVTDGALSDTDRMLFDQDRKIVLTGEDSHAITEDMSFELNTSTNPPSSLGILTDNCAHLTHSLTDCNTRDDANDGLRLINNHPVGDGVDNGDVKFEKGSNTNSVGNSDTITVGHSEGTDTKTVAGVAVDSNSHVRLEDYSLDSGNIERLDSIKTEAFDVYTFLVDDNSNGQAEFQFNDSANLAAITATADNAVESYPVTDVTVNNASDEISTAVESQNGDKLVDFLAAPEGPSSVDDDMSDMDETGLGGESVFVTKRMDGSDGEESMDYEGSDSMTHVVINLRKDRADAEYHVETDGYGDNGEPVQERGNSGNYDGDYPDEYAHTLVNSREDKYRTLVSSIGFESIKGEKNRKQLMDNTLRFLTGPVANNTRVYSGQDIPDSGADESRYTNSTLNIEAEGKNLQHNPTGLRRARFLHEGTPQGFKPTFESGFDNRTLFDRKWTDDSTNGGYSNTTSSCGVKKGDQALRLDAQEENEIHGYLDERDDEAGAIMSEPVNVSNHQNLVLEFYVHDNGAYCNGPDGDDGEHLDVMYKDNNGSYSKARTVYADSSYIWRKVQVEIPEDRNKQRFKVMFETREMNAYDAWLIDEVEINQGLNLTDGSWGDQEESVEGFINATKAVDNLDSNPRGANVTYGVQFKDDSNQGYWGVPEKSWVKIDTVSPNSLTDVSFEDDYTSDETVNISVTNDFILEKRANLTRFSCDPENGEWSEWRTRDSQQVSQKFEIDVTDQALGCSDSQGNRTVSVQTRDYAGNRAPEIKEDWIIYDAERPDFLGARPGNRSAVQSDVTVNITASDNFGISDRFTEYNAGQEDSISFTPNETVGLDFTGEGWRTLEAWIYDRASNLREVSLDYDIDDTAPWVNVTPESNNEPKNDTAVKPDETFRIEAFDRNFESLTVNSVSNSTFSSSVSAFDPNWSGGEVRDLEVWLNDSAGNQRFRNYSYTIDGQAPVSEAVDTANESYVTSDDVLKFNFSDSTSGVEGVFTSEDRERGVDWDLGVGFGSDASGETDLSVSATDRAGNTLTENYTYTLDDEPPVAETNYSREADSTDGWFNKDVEVEVNATDNQELDTIIYGSSRDGSVSAPELTSNTNTSIKVTCPNSNICEKVVTYNANDSAGNYFRDSYRESETVSIDKKAPLIEIGSLTQSGLIEIESEIRDPGIGVQDASFRVLNRSDTSQVLESGDLNESNNWSYIWHSEQDIDSTQEVTLKIEAEDRFQQNSTEQTEFKVENEKTTATITDPEDEIVSDNFDLSIEANRPGNSEGLTRHNFTINRNGGEVYSESKSLEGADTHLFDRQFDTTELDGDGNYSLKTTALSNETSEYATAEKWFYLDTRPPEALIETNINDSWVTGRIEIHFTASDSVGNGTLESYYMNDSDWQRMNKDLNYSDKAFNFSTSDRCQDSSSTTCGVKIVAEDRAGNLNSSMVEFKVDNSPPEVDLTAPDAEWQNSNFNVARNISDNVVDSRDLYCEVNVNSTGWRETQLCNTNHTVDISESCDREGEICQVKINASHPELPLYQTDQKFYSIDTEQPEIYTGPEPAPETVINGSEDISLGFQEPTSEMNYSKWDEGKGLKDLETDQPFKPGWTENGNRTLEILLNDTAGNLRTEQYIYTFDNKAPELQNSGLSVSEDGFFDETRVYRGEEIKLELNVSENIEMEKVTAEISSDGENWNRSLQLEEGNLTEGLWTKNLANTTTGLYTVQKVYLEDRAGNRTRVSSSLPEFRIVNYSETVEIGGMKEVDAGNSTDFNYTVDFNRTQGDRQLRVYVPPSGPGETFDPYFQLENVSCETPGCNVTYQENFFNLSYTGGSPEISVTAHSEAFTPEQDTEGNFTSQLLDNTRKSEVKISAPELEINSSSCNPACTLDQFDSFNLTLEPVNNMKSTSTGTALNTSISISSGGLEDRSRELGNLGTGENLSEIFVDISSDEAGNFTYEAVLEDATGVYRDSKEIEVEFLDAEEPDIVDAGPSSGRVNVNDSIDLLAELTDNVEVADANLSLEYPNGTAQNLSLDRDIENEWANSFNKTSEKGIYRLKKVYASDRRENTNQTTLNSQFKVTELRLNSSVSKTNIQNREAVNFTVNITGNSTEAQRVTVNASTPEGLDRSREYTDVGLNNTLEFDRFDNSGNYSFNVTVNAGLKVTNQTSDVFVRYGNSSVESLDSGNNGTLEIPETISSAAIEWRLTPINGSVKDVTFEPSSDDETVLSTGSTQSIADLVYTEGARTEELTVNPENTGSADITAILEAENGGNTSKQVSVEVTEQDNERPQINSFKLSEKDLNLNETLDFSANIADNSIIKNSTLEIGYPNSSNATETINMDRIGEKSYQTEFNNLNQTGNYTATLKAYDISGNSYMVAENFTVTDRYSIEIDTDESIYMKEEDAVISFDVLDASGDQVKNYSLNSSIEYSNSNHSLVEGQNVSRAEFTVERDYPPDITNELGGDPIYYSIYAEASSRGNIGKASASMPVHRVFDVSLNNDQYVAPGEDFLVASDWRKKNGELLPQTWQPFILCDACPSNYKLMLRDLETDNYVQNLTAPNQTGSYSFTLRGSYQGNSESQDPTGAEDEPPFGTFEVVPGGTPPNSGDEEQALPSGGGGGFSGGGPSMEIVRRSPPPSIPSGTEQVNLSVNTNIAAECVYSRNRVPEAVPFDEASDFQETGGVNHSTPLTAEEGVTYSYNIMCASGETNSTQEIIFSTETLEGFSYAGPTSVTPNNESVSQKGNYSARVAIYNEKSEALTVDLDVEGTCCNLSFMIGSEKKESVTIPAEGEKNLDLNVYSPLHVKPGSYNGTLKLTSPNESTSRPINYQVSRHPAVENYTDLRTRAGILNSTISDYRIAGIDTSNMEKAYQNLTSHLEEANSSIQRDDLQGLKASVVEARSDAERVRKMLDNASWKKYILLNWWKWAAGFVGLYILFFLAVMVGIPYYRIQTELTRINSQLESAVDARKKGEKQYFQRKIDKDTFNEMMTERQNEVLQLRGDKEDLKEELDGFLMSKLTLENYLKAPWKGMEEMEKWWAANRKARQNLKDEQEE